MIIDCISDLHGCKPALHGGDLLIVAGDLTARDTLEEHLVFCDWILRQDYKKVVWISGNHDGRYAFLPMKGFFLSSDKRDKSHISYLCDSGTEFEGLKIWGSPWTKTFPGMNPHCKAFTFDTEKELSEKWMLIPTDTNILITHSPSFGNYDWVKNLDGSIGPSVGSPLLWMWMLSMVPNLKLHVTGHIHEAYGHSKHANGIHLVNASIMDERYNPVNKPIRIIL
jgi:Icc-related predicted phosphoesterase